MQNENPFNKLGYPSQKVPKDLREKVMDDVNAAKLLMDLTSLFSTNYVETLESLFKTKKRPETKPNKDTN